MGYLPNRMPLLTMQCRKSQRNPEPQRSHNELNRLVAWPQAPPGAASNCPLVAQSTLRAPEPIPDSIY